MTRTLRLAVLGVGILILIGAHAVCAQCGEVQRSKLVARDGDGGDYFGSSVSVTEDFAVVGSPGADERGASSGVAFVFRRDNARWVHDAKLVPYDAAALDSFGGSVSIYRETVLISSLGDDDEILNAGAAYVFRLRNGYWVQEAKLRHSDREPGDFFGTAVAIRGNFAFVSRDGGTNDLGAVYCFRRLDGDWIEQAIITASDGAPGDEFGESLSFYNDTLVVGAPGDDDHAGSAYVFRSQDGGWVEEAKLTSPNLLDPSGFGRDVCIQRDRLIVGAPWDDQRGRAKGASHIFRLEGGRWTYETKLFGSWQTGERNFGDAVAISGNAALIGAPDSYGSPRRGHAYLFRHDGTNWVRVGRVRAPDDPGEQDYFGESVALSQTAALVGAPYDNHHGRFAGSAYLIHLGESPGISVEDGCPASRPLMIDWSCATPFSRVALLYSPQRQRLIIPDGNRCHGATLGISGPRLLLVSSLLWSDENGAGRLEGYIPDAACGGFLQLIDLETCAVSNVARIE